MADEKNFYGYIEFTFGSDSLITEIYANNCFEFLDNYVKLPINKAEPVYMPNYSALK